MFKIWVLSPQIRRILGILMDLIKRSRLGKAISFAVLGDIIEDEATGSGINNIFAPRSAKASPTVMRISVIFSSKCKTKFFSFVPFALNSRFYNPKAVVETFNSSHYRDMILEYLESPTVLSLR
jgi:hypothetical protein